MVGFSPDEGEILRGQLLWRQVAPDRGTDTDLALFTNVGVTETITEATLTEPAGAGYARIVLTDATWNNPGGDGVFVYPVQTFTPSGGDWLNTYGYAVISRGTTARIMAIEVDPNAPINILDGNDYEITPQMTMI